MSHGHCERVRQRITERECECSAWRNRIVSIDNRDRRHVPRRYRRSRTSVALREPLSSLRSLLLPLSGHIVHRWSCRRRSRREMAQRWSPLPVARGTDTATGRRCGGGGARGAGAAGVSAYRSQPARAPCRSPLRPVSVRLMTDSI